MPTRRKSSRKPARVKSRKAAAPRHRGQKPPSDEERRRLQRAEDMLMEIALRRGPRPQTRAELEGWVLRDGAYRPPSPSQPQPKDRGKPLRERLEANVAQHPALSPGRRAQMLGVHRTTVSRALVKLKPPPQ